MVEAVETMDGWYSLHDMRVMDWTSWKLASSEERTAAIAEFKNLLTKWEDVEEAENGSHVMYQAIGQKADFMFMFLRPTMEELADLETAFNKTKLAEFLIPSYSYVSVIELAKYRPQEDGVDPETLPETQARLKPILPKWNHMSFYPMSRRREGDDNWYTLEKDARGKLLYEHSKTGRQYAGKVKQFISGSIGFDDMEWGVTLFAHDVLQLKKVVYQMRFDEATARYGEFAEFFVGNHLAKEDLAAYLHV
ncbi:hydrogen peroxide-dependent heme synthase [Virgibacillus alimentarius]|uniref:hydrogen peroxide-dependent heme synthase n=1 Tax=Virgibacillus alimentarius TaxID=698769 RepID=UPI000493B226|nr:MULTISPECIES: hydrogen peroxide-dependent heme synthase [Virgibacillus]HLR67278.1 hydrogen peroxide-dependent heme synthase [Virgibacillus sp.]